jgi:diaminopimelate epimerase
LEKVPIDLLWIRKKSENVDGIVFVENSPIADIRMRIFNPDGSEANACGNALRCLPFFLSTLSFIQSLYRVQIGDQVCVIRFDGKKSFVCLGKPKQMQLPEGFINTGVPHLVLFVPDASKVDLATVAPPLRFAPRFQPDGTNVSVATILSAKVIQARTFERGVEGETLACGTAAAAIGAIATALHQCVYPMTIRFPGGDLEVFEEQEELWITGDVSLKGVE